MHYFDYDSYLANELEKNFNDNPTILDKFGEEIKLKDYLENNERR